MTEGPTTIVISRHIREGREADFEDLLRSWVPRLLKFPGHEGALIMRPLAPGREHGAVLRFRSWGDWEAFCNWDQYLAFLQHLQPLLEHEPRLQHLTGMEGWFPAQNGGRTPPRWKMAILTWVGVCFTVGVLSMTLGPILGDWSWFGKLLVMNAAVVIVLTWGVMPALSWLTSPWISPSRR